MMKKLCIFALMLLFLVSFMACSPAKNDDKAADAFTATDITGAEFAKALSLTDHTGKKRNLSDFKGKVVALFFGYTHCPDVCPSTMFDLKNAMKLLGDKSNQVQVSLSRLTQSAIRKQYWRNLCLRLISVLLVCAAACKRPPKRWVASKYSTQK